jgi:hypothetical protein
MHNNNVQGQRSTTKQKWQSIHLNNQLQRQSVRPKQTTTTTNATTAAKHPLDRNGGKASASKEKSTTKRDLDDADEKKPR